MIQSDHNFTHVTFAKLLSDWIIIVSIKETYIFWKVLDYEQTILSSNGSLAPLQKYGGDPWSSKLFLISFSLFPQKVAVILKYYLEITNKNIVGQNNS